MIFIATFAVLGLFYAADVVESEKLFERYGLKYWAALLYIYAFLTYFFIDMWITLSGVI